MDFSKAYRFSPGFAFRRESFGGILYHYEGVKPDPQVTFVDNPFLLDLLERVGEEPLENLIAGVARHFALTAPEEAVVRAFFLTLVERGALVERTMPGDAAGSSCEGSGGAAGSSRKRSGGAAGSSRERSESGRGVEAR